MDKGRYYELYDLMSGQKDPSKMIVFGNAEKWAFSQIADMCPDIAEKWIERIEAVAWNNYLTRDEAECIVSKLEHQNGRVGPMWSYDDVERVVESSYGSMEKKPYYNGFALYATMNMIASDHINALREFIAESELPRAIYMLSVEQLTDCDRKNFVREYFKV